MFEDKSPEAPNEAVEVASEEVAEKPAKKKASSSWKRVRHGRSKRYSDARALVKKEGYELSEAIELAKQSSTVKFDAAVDMHIKLGIDGGKSDQQVRGSVALPHGTGKKLRIAAFVMPENVDAAKKAGAEVVGGEDLIAQIEKTGKADFDIAVATPDMMRHLGKIARTLGQQGLMPNPKTETVGPDAPAMIEALSSGKVSFKSDKGGNVHQTIGRASFDAEKLTENAKALLDAVNAARPDELKGELVRKVTVAATMGPGVKVDMSAEAGEDSAE